MWTISAFQTLSTYMKLAFAQLFDISPNGYMHSFYHKHNVLSILDVSLIEINLSTYDNLNMVTNPNDPKLWN